MKNIVSLLKIRRILFNRTGYRVAASPVLIKTEIPGLCLKQGSSTSSNLMKRVKIMEKIDTDYKQRNRKILGD